MGTSTLELAEKLGTLAEGQQGYFTARQAVGVGYTDSVHGYHVRNGDWERVRRGIYRLSSAAAADWPDPVIWSLWSCGRDDEPDGVYGREAALAIHGHGQRPKRLQMYVPRRFRRNSKIPRVLELIKEDLPAGDVEERGGVKVTTLERTLRDLGMDSGTGDLHRLTPAATDGSGTGGSGTGGSGTGTGGGVKGLEDGWEGWDHSCFRHLRQGPVKWSAGMTFEEAIEAGED